MNIRAALYSTLAAASAVTTKIATYSGAPAIFTARPVPADAARPYLAVAMVADPSEDALNATRRRALYDVACVLNYTGSTAATDALAEAVRAALHQKRLTISGGRNIETRVIGAAEAATDATLTGITLTIEVRAQ